MRIHVTQEHIECGRPRAMCECPVALAVKPFLREPWVGDDGTIVNRPVKDGPFIFLSIEEEDLGRIRDFVKAFDAGFSVAPFSFEIELPEKPHEQA